MHSNNNGYERITPTPSNWNYEDPIGEELAGREHRSPLQSSRASRNKPGPIEYIPSNESYPPNNTPVNNRDEPTEYREPVYPATISQTSTSTSPYPTPPLLKNDRDKSVNNSVQSDVTVKKVVIDLEINIKINVR